VAVPAAAAIPTAGCGDAFRRTSGGGALGAPCTAQPLPAVTLASVMETTAPPARRQSLPPVPIPRPRRVTEDAGQRFVARLRAAAPQFATAAGAMHAVVPEVVPPARHRRSRCRVVLFHPDGTQEDLTFLGPAGRVPAPSGSGFDVQIRAWLATGRRREAAWLVPDPAAADGMAIDLPAWLSAT
jgi:hypothetical protein